MARRRSCTVQQEGVVDVLFWTRTTLKIKILELPREMQMVEWPLCDCVLKTDLSAPGNPQYTVAGNLASHLCGDRHRKKIVSLLQSPQQSLPSILIVSKLWSFTLHPLTGKMQCIQKHTRCGNSKCYSRARCGHSWGTSSCWSNAHTCCCMAPELAYEILEQIQQFQSGIQIEDRMLNINEVEYTQASIGCRFQNGLWLEQLIDDLDSGRVDPRTHENSSILATTIAGSSAWRSTKKTNNTLVGSDRFVERLCERQRRVGNDPDNIRVREPPWRSRR